LQQLLGAQVGLKVQLALGCRDPVLVAYLKDERALILYRLKNLCRGRLNLGCDFLDIARWDVRLSIGLKDPCSQPSRKRIPILLSEVGVVAVDGDDVRLHRREQIRVRHRTPNLFELRPKLLFGEAAKKVAEKRQPLHDDRKVETAGLETFEAAAMEALDYAERQIRQIVEEIPDGSYEAQEDFDSNEIAEPLPLALELTVEGSDLRLRFDAPPQCWPG
jgi:hypothetical protein